MVAPQGTKFDQNSWLLASSHSMETPANCNCTPLEKQKYINNINYWHQLRETCWCCCSFLKAGRHFHIKRGKKKSKALKVFFCGHGFTSLQTVSGKSCRCKWLPVCSRPPAGLASRWKKGKTLVQIWMRRTEALAANFPNAFSQLLTWRIRPGNLWHGKRAKSVVRTTVTQWMSRF